MLAGRKLLLADDSITIQKVVDLTFADEGVTVLCVNNGRDAIDRIEEYAPDVVLADVLMPQVNGYEVCEYIKQNEKLKHIPVMLLVGSFEPFDEAEARRVGADDTLTKPFQSIRRLIDKVGLLVSGSQPAGEAPTAELPKPDVTPEPETLSEREIEITTADTQPLPPELEHMAHDWALPTERAELAPPPFDTEVGERKMESNLTGSPETVSQDYLGEGLEDQALLDLDDYPAGASASSDEFHLDIDLDEVPEASPIESAYLAGAFAGQADPKSRVRDWSSSPVVTVDDETPTPTPEQLANTQEFERPIPGASQESGFETRLRDDRVDEQKQPRAGAQQISLEQLSPEMIDAIARRAVELLSEKVVQEIAWEVVPPLAELLIKRQLEEKNS